VVTREEIAARLVEARSDRDLESTIVELRRLGWLATLPVQGTWAFVPPGRTEVVDAYLGLQAWRAREPNSGLHLAGATAAWHLGYLDRSPEGPVVVWLPDKRRVPDGLQKTVSVVRIKWPEECRDLLGPSRAFLIRRRLDIVSWANGLPAFGPEALLVQLAARPGSFRPWADLVAHLEQLSNDCEDARLLALLRTQSASTWQRSAYLLHAAGDPERGIRLIDQRPKPAMPVVKFERPGSRDGESLWVPQYQLVDRLIAPLQGLVGKA
jgi:hypothetical protein